MSQLNILSFSALTLLVGYLAGKSCPRNYPLCVRWDVKPYSFTYSVAIFRAAFKGGPLNPPLDGRSLGIPRPPLTGLSFSLECWELPSRKLPFPIFFNSSV